MYAYKRHAYKKDCTSFLEVLNTFHANFPLFQ